MTEFCAHKHGCFENAARGLLRGFLGGYVVKSGLNVALATIFQRAWKKPHLYKQSVGKDSLRFALFVSTLAGSFKATNCAMRKLRGKEDGLNSLVAGLVSGSVLIFDEKKRRTELALYLAARAAEALFRTLVMRYAPIKYTIYTPPSLYCYYLSLSIISCLTAVVSYWWFPIEAG